jgi:hypothetical protein
MAPTGSAREPVSPAAAAPRPEAEPAQAEEPVAYRAPAPQPSPEPAPEAVIAEAFPRQAEPITAAEPAAAKAVEEPADASAYRARPAPQPFSLPPDMVQIETTHPGYVAEEPPAGEEMQARRPRRPRPEPVAPSEPLVQVETRQGE